MRTILYVCTGNTCRSPMAEAIARHWVSSGILGEEREAFVASAGIFAADGSRVSPETLESLRKLGIDLDGRSKMLTAEMIEGADLIFCMTQGHVDNARSLVPSDPIQQAKIVRLDPENDLEDPIGRGQEVYDRLAQRLMTLIPSRLKETLGTMRIAIGSDHRGEPAALDLAEHLGAAGHSVTHHARCSGESCDYPDDAWSVGHAVASGDADRGLLLCSNGIGMSIAANKVPGVRAALVYDASNAERSRLHNDANVLCLGGETNSATELREIVDLWLATPFEGGRHGRRVDKIQAIEAGCDPREVSNSAGAVGD